MCTHRLAPIVPRLLSPIKALEESTAARTAVVLVNSPSTSFDQRRTSLWNGSAFRACTDGAANGLRKRLLTGKSTALPDLIVGDFDSILSETYDFFVAKGVRVVNAPDQSRTDLTKCLSVVVSAIEQRHLNIDRIVTLGGLCGRFDHTLASLQSLFLLKNECTLPIFLVDANNLVTLIGEGTTHLEIDLAKCSGMCGLVPIGQPARRVTTSGLQWNLDNNELEFGKLATFANTNDLWEQLGDHIFWQSRNIIAPSGDNMSSESGLVSLTICLPGDREVEMDVDSETPMMDLLVQIACKYGLSPSGVALRVPSERSSGYIKYQPSTPVARLGSQRIEIVDRAELTDRPPRTPHHRPPGLPFEPTQRIQIDLGRYQKTFVRISTAATLGELVDQVCKQQVLNRRGYRIRAAVAPDVTLDEQLAIREVGTTVFSLVPIDTCIKRTRSTNDILTEIVKMPAEEKQKKKKRGFFGLFKSSKKSESKSPTRDGKGVANGAADVQVPRSRPVPEVVITDERRRGESDLSQSSSRKKRAAPKPPEPTPPTTPVTTAPPATPATAASKVESDRQSRRNSDSSSGYHESCASPIDDCSSSPEKRPVELHSAGKKKSRAPSPPPPATTHQGDSYPFALRQQSSHSIESAAVVTDNIGKDGKDEPLSDEKEIATGFDEAIIAGQQTMSTATINGMPMSQIDLNDIMPLPAVATVVRTPTPELELEPVAESPRIVAPPPPPPELRPQPSLSTPTTDVLSESADQTVSSPAAPHSVPVESAPVIAISPPPPAPPPPSSPLTLSSSKKDESESNVSLPNRPATLNVQTSPTLFRQQQSPSPDSSSPTDLSSQIAREAAQSLHKLSPIGQRRGLPMTQRQSNIVLNERQKDALPAMRVASFEEEYAVKEYGNRTNTPSATNESNGFVSLSVNNGGRRTSGEDGSDERLQKEYDKLREMFDEWQILSGRLEMSGGANDPTTSSRMRELQRELVQQHQTVQRLCAAVQTDAARGVTKNSQADSGTERSGSSQSSHGTANSTSQSPSPPPAPVFETPKSVAQTGQPEEKFFFVKETAEAVSASKKPTGGGSNGYRPKMHADNGSSSSPTNTPLRQKTTTTSQRPISVHGTAFANKKANTLNGRDIEHAFRQTKHPSTEDLVVTTGVVKPSMLFGERKQNGSAAPTSQPPPPRSTGFTPPQARRTPSVPSVTKNSVETHSHVASPSTKIDKVEQKVEVGKAAETAVRPADPIPNGSGGFAWPELRKVGPPVEKNGFELGAVVTASKTDTISRNYTVAENSKRQPLPSQPVNHAKSSSSANKSAIKENRDSVRSPLSPEPSLKAPVTNGGATSAVISSPPPPPPPPPPLNAEELVKQMGQVNLKRASDRKLKQPPSKTAESAPETRDQLLQAIRNAGGIGSLKKVKPVA